MSSNTPSANNSQNFTSGDFKNNDIVTLRWFFDKKNQRQTFSYVSQSIEHYGFNHNDFIEGKIQWIKVVHPEDRHAVVKEFEAALATGSNSGNYTASYRLKALGGYCWVQDHATFYQAEEDVIHVQSILVNISHVKNIEKELQEKNTQLNLLHETAIGLGERNDLKKTLTTVLSQLKRFSNNTDTYIALKNEDNSALKLVAGTGTFEAMIGALWFQKDAGAISEVWKSGKANYIGDYQNYGNRLHDSYTGEILSVACLPLIANGQFLGVIGYNSKVKIEFNDNVKAAHNQFTQLVSIALDTSQLVDELSLKLDQHKVLEEQLRIEQASLAHHVKFRVNLSELIEKSLAKNERFIDKSFFDMILNSAIQSIDGAEAGSLLVRQRDGKFHFVATNNYDLEELQTVVLQEEELHVKASCLEPILQYQVDNSALDSDRQVNLEQKLGDLQVTLSVPIHINQQLIALINIDNFSNREIFTPETIHLAQIYSRHISVLWKRFELEKTLSDQMFFERNMAQLVEASLSGNLIQDFYKNMLNRAIKVLPDAEGGSLIVKNAEGNYCFEATVGHDIKKLQHFALKPNQLYRDINNIEPMRIVEEDISQANTKNKVITEDHERYYQVVLSIPIHVNGEAVAMFSIDNFSKQSAFSEDTLKKSKIFANQISALWQRFMLEEALHKREFQYKELFAEATLKTNELSLLDELQHTISKQLELDQLFNTSLQKIIDIFDYSLAHIRILEDKHLKLVAQKGFNSLPFTEKLSIKDKAIHQLVNGETHVLIDSQNHSNYFDFDKKDLIQSLIIIPIYVNKEFFGTLGVGSTTRDLGNSDLSLIQKVVELMSVAIENAQLHTHVKRDLRRNESLHKISEAVQQHDNLNELLDSIVEYVRQAINARWAILYKIDLNKKCIESVSNTNLENSPLKILEFDELTNSLAGWAIENKQAAFTPKGITDERESPEIKQINIESQIGCVAVIPFINNDKVEGSIAVINHMDDPDFSDNDLQVLNTVANQVGAIVGKHKLMRQIEHQAFHDSLTDLPNRLQFENEVSSIIQSAQRRKLQFAVLFIDLDGFKHVNDTLGHALGDQLLIAVANRIQKRKRSEDILARMGGDEFAIVLKDVSCEEDTLTIANDYLKFFTEPYVISGYELSIGASIGVSLYPKDGNDIHSLLSNADSAMYQAKNSGKNSVSGFTESLAEEVKDRAKLERELKLAIERDELELHYQPQYNISSQEMIGLEALVRWRHPERGLIPPGIFIGIAEESNLIIDVGNWVLFEACRQNAEWQAQGHPALAVAVNISAKQFVKDDFVETVISALKKSTLQSEYLELEVTESIVMNDVEDVIERLELLQKLNINIAIDDFGTGYSSLTYLQDLPLDKLKIDKSFVDKLDGASNPAIIKTILTLAQSLGLTTIAEGVESKIQLEVLQDLGCDEAQGYYFAKPIPATEVFEDFVEPEKSATAQVTKSV